MVNRIISDFLGPFVVILQFFKTRPEWITIIFAAYLLVYALGVYQLRKIRERTHQLIEEKYGEWLLSEPSISKKNLFERFFPIWEADLKNMRLLYVMNKHDLWPVRFKTKNVLIKLPLDQDYIEEHLSVVENRKTGREENPIQD